MPDNPGRENDQHKSKHKAVESAAPTERATGLADNAPFYSSSLLGDPRLSGRGNTAVNRGVMQKMQGTHGNRSVQRFLSAQRLASAPTVQVQRYVPVQRFQIGGDMPGMDPVHQMITAEALKKAGKLGPGGNYKSPDALEYSKGAMWNDDPLSQLTKPGTADFDVGGELDYIHDFMKFEGEAVDRSKAGKAGFGPGENMLARTHFGDLGFIHGMAADDKEKPEETQRKIMLWAEFTSKIAEGQIGGNTKLSELGKGKDKDENKRMEEIKALFPELKGKNINELFGIKDGKGDVKARATGSLLHMIQDSYAGGHSERDADGKVKSFHSYTNQDHSKHGHSDELGKGKDLEEQLKNTPGAVAATDKSAEMLKMLDKGKSWEEIQKFLKKDVFALSPGAKPADAGHGYEKEPGFFEGLKEKGMGMAKKGAVDTAWNVKEGAKSVWGAANDAWDWGKGKFGEAEKGLSGAYNDASKWGAGKLNEAEKGLAGAYNDVSKWGGNKLSEAEKGLSGAYKDAAKWGGNKLSEAEKGLSGAYKDASKWGMGKVNEAEQGINGAIDDASNWGGNKVNEAEKGISGFMKKASGWSSLGDVAGGLLGGASDAMGWLGNAGSEALGGVGNAVSGAGNWLNNLGGEALGGLGKAGMQAGNWLNNVGGEALGGLGKAGMQAAGWLNNAGGEALGGLGKAGMQAAGWLNNAGGEALGGLGKAGLQAGKWLNKAGGEAMGGIANAGMRAGKWGLETLGSAGNIGTGLMEWGAGKAGGAVVDAAEAVGSAASWGAGKVKGAWDTVSSWF